MMRVVFLGPSAVSFAKVRGTNLIDVQRALQEDIDAHSARHGRPIAHLPPAGRSIEHGEHGAADNRRRRRSCRCAEHAPQAECRRHGHHHTVGRHYRSIWCVPSPLEFAWEDLAN
jgi:hypothetical protein